ncbi:3-oxoacyl-[acyl-carrier-protein] synthase III [Draconibacterium orientale]|jgi:3-oxoacyl-[acyl-carrier-protein] synthase-3|uniref:Beta-ketoacyl-[acyl-carrier-protein] synthase III n=1 Tax=Draconibacterium orientale TaxID=1168034 RepID=X5DZE8_9BACT|nr:beta-ketoacyl-ACP synthase III [Draconibacterium orientale]AHW59676.1 3-oxoacyl-ACP synthase [Draconibacterium orientale]SES79593.1 3-oxoacyl-[acyl-carrier-protein] synthase III [Draconibacterium orientale]
MANIRAAITGVGAFLPEYRLTNEEISKMVDTSDEWIMQRIGIKERRILKEEGKATSDMGARAVENLLEKTGTSPDEVDMLICATITPDMNIPATANIIAHKTNIHNAWSFDLNAACSGFIFSLSTATQFIESGRYKKVVIVAAEKMSSIINYEDRTTCPLFGDGAAAVLVEPSTEDVGVIDYINRVDGLGRHHLHIKAGGSLKPASEETVKNKEHYLYQEGQAVFKAAVSSMADVAVEIMEKHNISAKDIAWLVPHQANMRIIEATARRMGISKKQVMINIRKYGNTTAATIPLCLWDYEKQLKKGDNIILAAFGAGFTWGSTYLKWAYDPK